MPSLADCFKNLFSISDTINLNEEFNTIYPITLLQYNYDLNNNEPNIELSTFLYYIFIHLLSGIIRKYKEKSDSQTYYFLENDDILDYELIKNLDSLLDISELIFKLELFQSKILFVTVTKDKMSDLRNIIDKKYKNFQNEDFYNDLIAIQHLEVMFNASNCLSFQDNQEDKKIFGKYYSPEKLTNFIIRVFYKLKSANITISRILDPSCGSGMFLWSYLKILTEKNTTKDSFGSAELEGIDIDYKSLLTATLMVKFLQLNKNLTEKNIGITFHHKDYLQTDPDPENLFNLIIGNPPYIRERFFDKEYRTRLRKFSTYKGKSDIYFTFIEHSYKYLLPDGYLVFILPRYWIESEFGIGLREFIKSHYSIELLIDFRNFKIFNIGVHSLILIGRRSANSKNLLDNIFTVISVKETAKNLDKLYIFLAMHLTTANLKKDTHKMDEAISILENLHNDWVKIIELTREKKIQNHEEIMTPAESFAHVCA